MTRFRDLKRCPCGRLTANAWGICCRCGLMWRWLNSSSSKETTTTNEKPNLPTAPITTAYTGDGTEGGDQPLQAVFPDEKPKG